MNQTSIIHLSERLLGDTVMLVSASAGLLPGLIGVIAANAAIPLATRVIEGAKKRGQTKTKDNKEGSTLYKLSVEAGNRGDSERATALLEQAALSGDNEALLALAESLGHSNAARRRELLELAAQSGDTRALTELYLDSYETEPEYARTIAERLAAANDPWGLILHAEYLLPTDPEESLNLLTKFTKPGRSLSVPMSIRSHAAALFTIAKREIYGDEPGLIMTGALKRAAAYDALAFKEYVRCLDRKKAQAFLSQQAMEGNANALLLLAEREENAAAKASYLIQAIEHYSDEAVEQLMLLLSCPQNAVEGYRNTFAVLNRIYENNKTRPQPQSMIKEIYLCAKQPHRGQGKQYKKAFPAVEAYVSSLDNIETNYKFYKTAINQYMPKLIEEKTIYARWILMVGGESSSDAQTAEELFTAALNKSGMKDALDCLKAQSYFCHGPAHEMVTKAIRNAMAIHFKDNEA